MIIGNRLSVLRKQKNLSQSDIEKRCGLLRCYISRVENGHTVPSVETLEKMARALEIPIYKLFCEDSEPAKPLKLPRLNSDTEWPQSERDSLYFAKLRKALARMQPAGRQLVMSIAQKVSSRNH